MEPPKAEAIHPLEPQTYWYCAGGWGIWQCGGSGDRRYYLRWEDFQT